MRKERESILGSACEVKMNIHRKESDLDEQQKKHQNRKYIKETAMKKESILDEPIHKISFEPKSKKLRAKMALRL